MSDQLYINFDEYIRQGEPAQRERADAWRVAIGLQAVDGLKTSEYLHQTARRNIEGEITIDEARELVKQYYVSKTTHDEDDADKEEADRVSGNIAKLLLPEGHQMPESTPQVQDKHRTSTGQVQDKIHTDTYNIIGIIQVIEFQQLSGKEIMTGLQLKGRDNFLNLYLLPAIAEGYVRLLYPDKPRHPRQKYLLTVKGLALYNEMLERKEDEV